MTLMVVAFIPVFTEVTAMLVLVLALPLTSMSPVVFVVSFSGLESVLFLIQVVSLSLVRQVLHVDLVLVLFVNVLQQLHAVYAFHT